MARGDITRRVRAGGRTGRKPWGIGLDLRMGGSGPVAPVGSHPHSQGSWGQGRKRHTRQAAVCANALIGGFLDTVVNPSPTILS